MGNKLKTPIKSADLAAALKLKGAGNINTDINEISSFDEANKGSLSFSKTLLNKTDKFNATIIAPKKSDKANNYIIHSENPRLDFARALSWINENIGFENFNSHSKIHASAVISPTAVVGDRVYIGKNTNIGDFVVIRDDVSIGEGCIIKSGSIIGEKGFGFERDESGVPIPLLHIGSVSIGNYVEIGTLNTVCRATLGTTVIEDYVKTDDHVHIAHNCRIQKGALLTACVELSGGVDIGEQVWIGPNSSITQKVVVGKNAFIGIASNVIRNVAEGSTVAGNPAKVLS